LSEQCSFIKEDASRCRLPATGPQGLCWSHDPNNAAKRRRVASRGGRGKANLETRAIKKLMDELTTKVLAGDVEPAVSHAVVALQNIKLRAIEIERRLEEADVRAEFEELKRELGIS
jgi:hypothetical protein